MTHLEEIFQDNPFCFKFRINLGLILKHTDTSAFRYFVPDHNVTLFSVPIYMRNRRDLDRICNRLSQLNVNALT